jgi:hypothetical protein
MDVTACGRQALLLDGIQHVHSHSTPPALAAAKLMQQSATRTEAKTVNICMLECLSKESKKYSKTTGFLIHTQ